MNFGDNNCVLQENLPSPNAHWASVLLGPRRLDPFQDSLDSIALILGRRRLNRLEIRDHSISSILGAETPPRGFFDLEETKIKYCLVGQKLTPLF